MIEVAKKIINGKIKIFSSVQLLVFHVPSRMANSVWGLGILVSANGYEQFERITWQRAFRLSEKYISGGSTRKIWRQNQHEFTIGKSDFVMEISKKGFSDSPVGHNIEKPKTS